jgi:hypothetical protein
MVISSTLGPAHRVPNNAVIGVPGLAINVAGPRAIRTPHGEHGNEACDAADGLSNVSCGGS